VRGCVVSFARFLPAVLRGAVGLIVLSAVLLPAGLAGAATQDIKVIRIGAGPTGATDFPFGGLIANAISNPPGSRECARGGSCGVPGLIAVAQTTGGAMDNLRAVSRGDLDLALSQADLLAWAYNATGPFAEQEALANLRIIARLYPANVHLIARADAGIASIADLRGKKVSMGSEASGVGFTARLILSAFAVKWSSVTMVNIDLAHVAEALTNGEIDAFFTVSGAPVLALEGLAGRLPVTFIPIGGPAAAKLVQVFPFYTLGAIPAGTYGDHPEIPTLDVGSVLVARDDMDQDLAFGIARAIWHERNTPLFRAGHARGRLMDSNLAARGLGAPVHPGAARYYVMNNLMAPPAVSAAPAPAVVPAVSPVAPSAPADSGS